ncbi:RibD (Riboflavin-specific deaminase) [Rhodopirellula maiorica SM1]|uniref:Riboflavin biosynthesis protein RibD n=1 Tax=Rhodopirellula maiorica SM1 TaxID=1265738 RepID=M5RPZ7_9BACT|nr:bifunctional diaminohydroxyphosphoribosylaminopyrimidine deaminase/5-amino-6-(5-phosphoribosylamino)uracil reductase RibD [Rhodopirellula maiorica]EMI21360.1 RibD (Riboflavin-specific deaminase) [Rhodopirellula maiorica SM1]
MNSSRLETDDDFMRLALGLAERGRGSVEPNPMVGCVIVRDNQVIGEGYHQRFGGPHAEVHALRDAGDARGATAYVTLEPCCHHGKTPPCSDALIAAGISRVVVAMADPFEKVDGGGVAQLQRAGIETRVGVLEQESRELNAPYLKRLQTGRPYTIAKWAMTVDGRIATSTGQSQWISNEVSRADVHVLRGRVDAIAVGMGTVIADDPMLTARPAGVRTATRVVFCANRLPTPQSRLIQSANEVPVLLIVSPLIAAADVAELEQLGASVYRCTSSSLVEMINQGLDFLGGQGMTNVMIEGGGKLMASFLTADAIDQYEVYVGAKVFGGHCALGPVAGDGFASVAEAAALRLESLQRLGDNDVKLVYRRLPRD